MYLFIDTTTYITVGLLDSEFKWLSYKFVESNKSSAVLHKIIYDVFTDAKLEISDLKNLIYTAGPGSYTGMRVGQGLADIFNWQNISMYSFYHFDVPMLCQVEQGEWYSKAFKGEYFLHRWDKGEVQFSGLVPEDKMDFTMQRRFTGFTPLDQENCELTKDLIYEKSQDLFSKVITEKMCKELFYYRPIEVEFQKKK